MAYSDDEIKSWEDELKGRLGDLYNPSVLGDVVRNTSYEQNKNMDPQSFIDREVTKEQKRLTNTPNQDGGSNASGSGNAVIQSWSAPQGGGSAAPTSSAAIPDPRRDALYAELQARADRGLSVNANDPIIKGQVDSYRAEQDRAKRNFISDVAEAGGPLANIRGEERMANERAGVDTAAFQAETMSRELMAQRQELAQNLTMRGSILSEEDQNALREKIAMLDNAIAQANVANQSRGLDLQSRGLDLQALRDEMQNRQFTDSLGLQAEDRASYWDSVRSGY